jgi:hypothetical protein
MKKQNWLRFLLVIGLLGLTLGCRPPQQENDLPNIAPTMQSK